jgi:hypothetical protein
MKLTITSTTGDFVTLCECKEYLKVNDESRDDLIMRCAKMATNFVENAVNESLNSHTVQLITNQDVVHQLYLPNVDVINSVKNAYTGEIIDYTSYVDNSVIAIESNMAVVVDYNTIPATGDTTAEKMAVLALTSLIYDGVTDRNVWNSVITNYLAHKLPL